MGCKQPILKHIKYLNEEYLKKKRPIKLGKDLLRRPTHAGYGSKEK